MRAKLIHYVTVYSKRDFYVTSEVGWISNSKLILTVNNEYYLLSLSHKDLYRVTNDLAFGTQ